MATGTVVEVGTSPGPQASQQDEGLKQALPCSGSWFKFQLSLRLIQPIDKLGASVSSPVGGRLSITRGKGSRGRMLIPSTGPGSGGQCALCAPRPRGFRSAQPPSLAHYSGGKEGPSRPKARREPGPRRKRAEDRRGGRILRSDPPVGSSGARALPP